jgi:predicted DNA-binding protein
MSTSDDKRRVHFHSPEHLVDRLDEMAEVFGRDRTDLLVEAMREYIEEKEDSERFRNSVASRYYDDEIGFETVKRLVGTETAQRFRLLKSDPGREPFDIPEPEEVDVYEEGRRSVETSETSKDGSSEARDETKKDKP